MATVVLTSTLRDIPRDLFDAMTVDGAGTVELFRRLVLPLSRPGLVSVGIFSGLNAWNGFILPLVLTQSEARRVIPLGLWNLQSRFGTDVPGLSWPPSSSRPCRCSPPTGDPVADEVLAKVRAAPRRETPQEWLQRLGGLRHRLLDGLVERGVLRRERDRVLLVFRQSRYPSGTGAEPATEADARRRLREALEGAGPVDLRTAALCALVVATGLEPAVFP